MTEGNKNRATLDQDKQIETCCRLDHVRACVSFAKLKADEIISESFSHYLGCRLDLMCVRFEKFKVGVISFRKFGQYHGHRFDRVQIRQCVRVCM